MRLIELGWALIVMGMLVIVVGSLGIIALHALSLGKTAVESGGAVCVLLLFIPICFSAGKIGAAPLLLMAITAALGIVLMVIALIMLRSLSRTVTRIP